MDEVRPLTDSDMPLPFQLSGAAEDQIRSAAREALRRSLNTLIEERVLPRSRYRPWIWMARDYSGHAVEHDGPLAKALQEALPSRFERTPGPSVDMPWGYASA